MKENRIYCDHPANKYCNLSPQLSCLQFNNCPLAPCLSEIGITCSLDDFQVVQAAASLTVEDILFEGVGLYNSIKP